MKKILFQEKEDTDILIIKNISLSLSPNLQYKRFMD